MYFYQPDTRRDEPVILALTELAERYPRYGFKKLFQLLRRQGSTVPRTAYYWYGGFVAKRVAMILGCFDVYLRNEIMRPDSNMVFVGDARNVAPTTFCIALRSTLRSLAKRWMVLTEKLNESLDKLTCKYVSNLRSQSGVGPQTAATLLAVADDNPPRTFKK